MNPVVTRAAFSGDMANATAWITPAMGADWSWDDSGEAILWEDGVTVVMAEELALICERYGDQSPPALAAIVTALAMLKGCQGAAIPPEIHAEQEKMARWPAHLLRTPAAKQVLIDLLFHDLHDPLAVPGDVIARLIRMNWRPGVDDRLQRRDYRSVNRDMLRAALKPVSAGQLRSRLETGLETTVKPAGDLPQIVGYSPRTLMERLSRDPETTGILRLTRDIMAALTLPQAMPLKDERAAGGVSDLSNRGPLHRLLLSELAHDDDMLAARLALNEALYLHPEPPAHRPPGAQILILDTGLRLWGAARIFALSAALALRLKARSGTATSVWRARGRHWEEADLDTVEGIKAHLGVLEATYDLTPALAGLPARLEPAPESRDVILFVHEATLLDPGFRRELTAHLEASSPLHIVAVNAEGRLALHQYSAQGYKLLHEARLHLERLLEVDSGNNISPPALRAARPWPAICNLSQLPFLIAPLSRVMSAVTVRDQETGRQTTFGLTVSREFWYIRGSQQGSRPIPMTPLRGKVLEFRSREEPETGVVACSWEQESGQLEIAVVSTTATHELPEAHRWIVCGVDKHPQAWWVDGDHLVFLTVRTIRAVRLSDGLDLSSCELPAALQHLGERHFYSGTGPPYTVHHCLIQGSSISFAAFGQSAYAEPKLAFHRKGQLGVWQVGANGVIISPSGSHHMEGLSFPHRLSVAKANPEGNLVWMKTHYGSCFIRDLNSGQLHSDAADQSQWPFYVEKTSFVHFSMRTRFESVGLTAGGEVALRTSKGRTTVLALSSTWFRLDNRPDVVVHEWCEFRPPEPLGDHGSARVAEWPSGSRAFLDERGLLHLQAANPAVPELTFGLPADMMLPAWSSDGQLVGPAATLDEGRPVTKDAATIEKHLRQFVMETLS